MSILKCFAIPNLCSVNNDKNILKQITMEKLVNTEFNVPTKNEVSEANQQIFDSLHNTLGFVPNLYATIAYSDNGLSRYLNYQNAKTSLSSKEKEAINLIVSEINGCVYCQSAHCVIGKMNGFDDSQLFDIRNGKSENAKLHALVKLAAEATENKGNVSDSTIDEFFAQGYTKENLVDVILQISDKIVMNYLYNLTKIPIDFPLASSL